MDAKRAAAEIKRAYEVSQTVSRREWVSLAEIAERVDLSTEQMTEGIRHLMRNEPGFNAIPESNQRMLTPIQHATAVRIGGQDKHHITWQR